MDAGCCLLAAQEEELTDENYRMFLSDAGSPKGQVWVLGCGDPEAEGKTCAVCLRGQKPCFLMSAAQVEAEFSNSARARRPVGFFGLARWSSIKIQ